jgi:hypothetical protein
MQFEEYPRLFYFALISGLSVHDHASVAAVAQFHEHQNRRVESFRVEEARALGCFKWIFEREQVSYAEAKFQRYLDVGFAVLPGSHHKVNESGVSLLDYPYFLCWMCCSFVVDSLSFAVLLLLYGYIVLDQFKNTIGAIEAIVYIWIIALLIEEIRSV